MECRSNRMPNVQHAQSDFDHSHSGFIRVHLLVIVSSAAPVCRTESNPLIRPVLDFVVEQINENREQQKINEREQNQRREHHVRLHHGGQALPACASGHKQSTAGGRLRRRTSRVGWRFAGRARRTPESTAASAVRAASRGGNKEIPARRSQSCAKPMPTMP